MIRRVTLPLSDDVVFDEIVDVRAPVEYAEDHVTGAINLPVLTDEERQKVGWIYKQESAFNARKVGAALVSKNISQHLEEHFSDKSKEYSVLLYCWRGGQRSGSMATVLSSIGWKVFVIEDGYRAYRRHVVERLEEQVANAAFVVLNGYTGAGKTLVLQAIEAQGGQMLDLEGLACHKGSVFGGDPENPQPQQKRFESLLFDSLSDFDLSRPIFLEAESAKIGRLNLPNTLWQKMKSAPVIEIDSPRQARADYLTKDYEEWLGDIERVQATLDRLRGFHSHQRLAEWKERTERGEWNALVLELLEEHYDRRYKVGGTGHFQVPSGKVKLDRHDSASVARCAEEVIEKGMALSFGEPLPC
ncbi:MAG: tRNA 2-selenouridine(34) synthase MnmH [Verrucomicrobiales bacterium]|nr:tRNA 2-selenouridine(34) synthase MnmH [Verrucomicrobiales bacterium]